jgi:hypothetical protein
MDDIFVGVAVALTSAALAYMGWHVTLHPPSDQNKKRWVFGFVGLSLVSVVLAVVQAYRSKTSSEALNREILRLEDQIKNEGAQLNGAIRQEASRPINVPAPIVNMNSPSNRYANMVLGARTPAYDMGKATFMFDQPILFNLHFFNAGNDLAQNVVAFGETRVLDGNDPKTERALFAEFSKNGKTALTSNAGTVAPSYGSQTPPEIWITTKPGPVLTHELWDQIRSGKKFIYIIDVVRYSDQTGTWEQHECSWLTLIGESSDARNGKTVYQNCTGYHDRVKVR